MFSAVSAVLWVWQCAWCSCIVVCGASISCWVFADCLWFVVGCVCCWRGWYSVGLLALVSLAVGVIWWFIWCWVWLCFGLGVAMICL